jgi:hypothetical protein
MIDGEEAIVPVTLADLLLAVFVAGVTAIASTNLPGLMEIAVLQRITLQPGSRYAINTLLRYVVITIGAIAVLNIVGWNWSQIQWLVAALSVGLGFGLQEIVANFVSGLVILFERPIRVGDTVTVGELTGTVSRVRIRATHRVAGPHSRNNDYRLGSQGNYRPEQVLHNRAGHQLDAVGPDHPRSDNGRRLVRLRRAARASRDGGNPDLNASRTRRSAAESLFRGLRTASRSRSRSVTCT